MNYWQVKRYTKINWKNVITTISLFSLLIIGACSQDESINPESNPQISLINATITHDGVEREYILYVPAGYSGDSPVPLVFNFHGWTQYNFFFINQADFRPIADTAGFILVYPQGIIGNDGNPYWNTDPNLSPDDIGFTEAMIDKISTQYNIDSARVYATGYSNGGYLSYALACFLSDRIAAIAPVKGSMYDWMTSDYVIQHPTPVLAINNTADILVPYNGSQISHPVEDAVQFWCGINNCNQYGITTPFADINDSDGVEVERIVYNDGNNGVIVELIKEIDSSGNWGHSYPASLPNAPWYFDAPTEIWAFFSQYDINGRVE